MSNELKEYNINYPVYVKLTDTGIAIMKEQHKERQLGYPNHTTPFIGKGVDDDGFSKWQLWDLMNVFGGHMTMGLELPFETTIKLVENKDK